jgi:hypothetical protein
MVRGWDRRRSGLVSNIVDPEAIDFELPPSLAGLSPCAFIWHEFGRGTGKDSTLALSQTPPVNPIYEVGTSQNHCRRLAMTSAQARSRLVTRLVYFSVAATVLVFVSMLLLTGLHP